MSTSLPSSAAIRARKLVVVKSAQHFRAAFAAIAEEIIMVEAPGVVARDLSLLQYQKIKRPKWPLDELPKV